MAITDTLNSLNAEKEQVEDAFAVRAALMEWTNFMDAQHHRIQEIVDSGHFNLLPADLKTVLTNWWNILKTARTSVGTNADIMAAYTWSP